ncbi:hypothetical protein MKX07_008813 [Trichoderma sp. CBMAI-0711]|nr:hypothetical protein MKX07_008813 [Trichoderma sp. CBMAI-0711]
MAVPLVGARRPGFRQVQLEVFFEVAPVLSVLLSEQITFLIGPNKKRFTMHKATVETLSKNLDQLLNGPMEEAQTRCVSWEDTDEDTFIRFGEWAYTGGYKAEESEVLLDSSQIATSDQDPAPVAKQEPIAQSLAALFQIGQQQLKGPAQHCSVDWSSKARKISCETCKTTYASKYCASCHESQYMSCENCRKKNAAASCPRIQSMAIQFVTTAEYTLSTPLRRLTRTNKESCEVYTQVFLSHAKLYVFADKYDIPDLRKLCLHNLHETLKYFTLYYDRIGDIVSLVRYSFENTIENDKLRSLLVEYCACFAKEMTTGKDFEELVGECQDFAFGLIRELGRHLN